MPAYLEPTSGDTAIFLDRGVTVFGCDIACDVCYTDSSLSPRHFAVATLEASHVVCDLGSQLGVSINGERVVGRQPIRNNDVVSIADLAFIYRSADHDNADTVALPIISPEMFPQFDLAKILPRPAVTPPVEKPPEEFKPKPLPVRVGAKTGPLPKVKDAIEPDPNRPVPHPQPASRPKMRRRQSDLGTRVGGRRKLLAKGKTTGKSNSDKKARQSTSESAHRETRRLQRQNAARQRLNEDKKKQRAGSPSRGPRSPSDDQIGDALGEAVAFERGANSARLMDAHCPHCNFTFCHVNDGFSDPDEPFKVECQRCLKQIEIKPEDEVEVVEARWSQPTWNSIIGGLDILSFVGLGCVFVLMVQFTMLAGKAVGKFGEIAGSTFLVFENTVDHDGPSLMAAGVAMVIFGMAPVVLLAATRVVAEDFTMPMLGAAFFGCLLAPLIWKSDPGIPIAKFGFFLYAITGLAIITGMMKFTDTKDTGLTRPIPIGLIAFAIAVLTMFGGCFATSDTTGLTEIIASRRLAMWAIGAGIVWVAAQVCQLQYLRGVSKFLREPMLTKSLEECSVFSIVIACFSFIALLLLATGAAKGTASDVCWLVAGFGGVLNTMWFFQVARFTRYAIR